MFESLLFWIFKLNKDQTKNPYSPSRRMHRFVQHWFESRLSFKKSFMIATEQGEHLSGVCIHAAEIELIQIVRLIIYLQYILITAFQR